MGLFGSGRGIVQMNRPTPPPTFWSRHTRKILGGALLLLAIQDVFGAHGFLAMWRTQQEMKKLQAEVTRLNKENTALSSQVTSLKTDPKAIERIAREEMGLARPGEMIFKMPAPAAASGDSGKAH
jgi:cell division protein FtsB